jgi:protein-disulfide isomerase
MTRLLAVPALLLLAAAPVNWTARTSVTPTGAFVMGNPAAKVRLVEYLSFTCSHCAHYANEGSTPIKTKYVAKGKVAVELRHAVRDQYDFAASLLSRCGGPARAFGNAEALFRAQATWMGKIEGFVSANGEKMSKLPVNQQLVALANGVGLSQIMKTRGFTQPQINACLASKPAQDQVIAMTNEAWNTRKIAGTPTFLINGGPITQPGTWAGVDQALTAALTQ